MAREGVLGTGVDGKGSTSLSRWSRNGKAGPVAPGSLIAGQNPEARPCPWGASWSEGRGLGADWARTAGDLWLCSWQGSLAQTSGAQESLLPESQACPTSSRLASNQPSRLFAASRARAPSSLIMAPLTALAHPGFMHSTAHTCPPSGLCPPCSLCWDVLWLPTAGIGDQQLEELRSSPAHFTSWLLSQLPSALHIPAPQPLAWAGT